MKNAIDRLASAPRLFHVAMLAPREQGYFRDLALGVSDIAASRGWVLTVIHPYGCPWLVKELRDAEYDAIIFTESTWDLVPPEIKRGRVLVATDNDLTQHGVPSVVFDNRKVGALAAQHFIERGYRSFGTFGARKHHWCVQRIMGFGEQVEAAGGVLSHLEMPDEGLVPAGVIPWLLDLPKPAAVFVGCDDWGAALASFCRKAGIQVPEQVALVGVDDDEFVCQISVPALSSVALPLRRLGSEAALIVDRLLQGRPLPERRVLLEPAGVVARRSSDMVAVEDPDVAAALAFIHRHADKPLSVMELLREVPASQSRLERGFRRLVGRTMVEEIRRVHVEQARRLLATTELPTHEIAERSGFPSATKLGMAFRRETGLTPTQYRLQFRQQKCSARQVNADFRNHLPTEFQ